MRNLYLFFRKYHFYFLFLLLELIALILFANFNGYQNAASYKWTGELSGSYHQLFYSVRQYFGLARVNRSLVEEMATLQRRMPEAIYTTDMNSYIRNDTLFLTEYRYAGARVIHNTVNKRNNFLMIEKGAIHGIRPDMGVIVGNRVVGQVVAVSRHFSWVMSALHSESRISGKLKKNDQMLTVEWPGKNYRKGVAREIPQHVHATRGDTIVTSGYSEVFPEGIGIGVIETVMEDPSESFKSADIRFFTDFNALGFVEVVIDRMKSEKDSLKTRFR
jgi:rod shape-determining protein MreC